METIIHNGEKYVKVKDILEKLGYMCADSVEASRKGPFDQQKTGDLYFFIGPDGAVDCDSVYDSDLFTVANYCADKELLEQRALHETLNRLLWRYSEQHGGDMEWGKDKVYHYMVCYDYLNGGWSTLAARASKVPGEVFFRDEETARKAIKEIVDPFMDQHPEFVW